MIETASTLREEIIIRLRDAGYDDYISIVEKYTAEVYEKAQKEITEIAA